MHSIVRRYIKTAILFLGVGLLLGMRMVVQREILSKVPTEYDTSAHTHAILVGFVMMMILGVALWLFPRAARSDEQYDPRLTSIAYWLLTIGTAARIVAELARSYSTSYWLKWTVVLASLSQIAGIAVFFFTMWPRIRSAGSHIREAKGEKF
jgi:heme/copper-type cytochrome/quinol oxidase subunit 1